jgi:hypothetical protein
MAICALELADLLRLMATDIDNDDAFIRIDKFYTPSNSICADGHPLPTAIYLGPVPS